MELQDKLAVVTGVSKGIGKATVQALLDNGAKVAGWGRNGPDIEHDHFFFCQTDVTDLESVEQAYGRTAEHFGSGPDILVNNAGLGYSGPMEEMPVEQWKQMFDTNVHGIYHCSRKAIPAMKEKGGGHIINIGSIAATGGVAEMAGYCGTKHAVRGISRALFKEVRFHGIKVTCVNPGSVQTDFFSNIEGADAHDKMMKPSDIAGSLIDLLHSGENYLPSELEVRPLKPK